MVTAGGWITTKTQSKWWNEAAIKKLQLPFICYPCRTAYGAQVGSPRACKRCVSGVVEKNCLNLDCGPVSERMRGARKSGWQRPGPREIPLRYINLISASPRTAVKGERRGA